MVTLQELLPATQGGGPFLPVHPVLRDVGSGSFGPYAKVDWKKLAALLGSSNAIGPVGGNKYDVGRFRQPQITDEDLALSRMTTGEATLEEISPLFKAKPEVIETYGRLLADARRRTQEKIKAKPSWFDRVVDVLSRPSYMGVNFVGELLNPKFSKGSNPLSAAWKGLSGKEKATTAQILEQAGWKKTNSFWNNLARGAVGFAGDVLLDPTTYFFGAGAVKNIGTKAAVKAGTIAKLGHEIEQAGNILGDVAKVGTRVPGLSVAGTRSGEETFAEFASRIGQRLKSDKPYLTRREVKQVREILGTRMSNAIGSEAENKLVTTLRSDFGITDPKILKKLGDSKTSLQDIFLDPKLAHHYRMDPERWNKIRATVFKEPEIAGLTNKSKELTGLKAFKAAERSSQARSAVDEIEPLLQRLEALPQMKRYEASVGIPFTRLRKAWEIPGIERKTGKFVEKMEAINRGRETLPGGKTVAKAWKAWDDTFNTAMKRDPSLAGVRTDFQSRLSHSLESVSQKLNNSFAGLNRVDRRAVMQALENNSVKGLSHITNKAGESMDKVVKDFFDSQADIINDTLNIHGGKYKGIIDNLTTGVPGKYRFNRDLWEKYFDKHKFHPRDNPLTGDDLQEIMHLQYHPQFQTIGRHRAGLRKGLDPAEALYHLSQGTLSMSNRRGFIRALKEFGTNQGFYKYDPKSGKRTLVSNPAGVRQMELNKGKMRKIQEKDFTEKELNDPHLRHVKDTLEDTAFPEELIPDLLKVIKMTNPKNMSAAAEKYVNVMQRWKRLNTIWNIPRYHLRNTYSDLAMNHLNGLAPNSMFMPNSPYGKASKVLWAVAPDKTTREMISDIYTKFNPGEYPNLSAKQKELGQQLMSGAGLTGKQVDKLTKSLITKNGESLNALDIYSLYRQHGLESHFMNEDIARVNLHRSEVFNPRSITRGAGEVVFQASAVRENYFRVANFIHSLERGLGKGWDLERAAQQAAEDVRKYNFDYSDVTPREQMISQRVLPFYKWSRKAIPLLATSTFTNPRVMAIWNHFQDAVQTAVGEQDVDKNNPLPGFYDRVPSSMIEGGMFPVASRFGDPVMSSGIPNLWRDTLPFLTTPQYKEGFRNEAGTTLSRAWKMLGGMTGPVGQAANLSGFGGMPGVGETVAGTPAGTPGQDWTKFITQSIGGPANLLRQISAANAYNKTQGDYPEGMPIDPTILRYLTGTNMQQLTSPQQMYAMQNLIDMLQTSARAQNTEEGRLTNRQRLQQNQSWNAATESKTLEELLAMLGIGG